MTKKRPLILLCSLLVLLPSVAQQACPLAKFKVEHLPSLNIPRSGHNTFVIGDEIIAVGGHTTGFVPTATAEYFKDGEWHLVPTVYEHDGGFTARLQSGKVIVVGGFEKHLGIGQTYVVERYDPVNHSFDGFGCLDKKRALASGLRLDNGQVIISGNWYNDDAIELFDERNGFSFAKPVTQQRARPIIFRVSPDDAMIFGTLSPHSTTHDSIWVDRLRGEPFQPDLFTKWKPTFSDFAFDPEDSFIGDNANGNYAYLFPVVDQNGQVAIAQTHETDISLLPTRCPVPMKSPWGQPINYYSHVVVDRQSRRAYLTGIGKDDLGADDSRIYVLCIDYAQGKDGQGVPLTLYYSDQIAKQGGMNPVLTPNGNLLMVGGSNGKTANGTTNDNFHPCSTVFLLRLGSRSELTTTATGQRQWTGWLLTALLAMAAVATILSFWRKHEKAPHRSAVTSPKPSMALTPLERPGIDLAATKELMIRITDIIEKERLYLNSDLKVSDIAERLGVSRYQVSDCINAHQSCSFPQYINNYRVEQAKQIMRTQPGKKITTVCTEAGFGNEPSFFRAFKTLTGLTPTEWKSQL